MNKQIEEMYQDFLDYKEATLCKVFTYKGMCENFLKLGYQKVDKDKVILSKEAYEQLLKEKDKLLNDRFAVCHALRQEFARNKVVAKEAVTDFAQTLISLFWEEEEGETVRRKDVQSVIRDVLRAHYKVEIEL